MLEFMFTCLLIALTDLLEKGKDVSLIQQTVKCIPWEVMRAVLNLRALMDGLPAKLEQGHVDEWAFPTLSRKRAELESGTFHGEQLTTNGAQSLYKSNAKKAFKYMLKFKLGKWCDLVYQYVGERFIEGHSEVAGSDPV
eukprot:gene20562-24643_t